MLLQVTALSFRTNEVTPTGLVHTWCSAHGADGDCKGLAKLLDAATVCSNLVVFSGSGLSATSGAWLLLGDRSLLSPVYVF